MPWSKPDEVEPWKLVAAYAGVLTGRSLRNIREFEYYVGDLLPVANVPSAEV